MLHAELHSTGSAITDRRPQFQRRGEVTERRPQLLTAAASFGDRLGPHCSRFLPGLYLKSDKSAS